MPPIVSWVIAFTFTVLRCVGLSVLTANAAQLAEVKPPKAVLGEPRLLVEAWLDRPWVSDLYLFDLKGNRVQRLTDKPLPTCVSQADAAGRGRR